VITVDHNNKGVSFAHRLQPLIERVKLVCIPFVCEVSSVYQDIANGEVAQFVVEHVCITHVDNPNGLFVINFHFENNVHKNNANIGSATTSAFFNESRRWSG
jgi:hypothetical protein